MIRNRSFRRVLAAGVGVALCVSASAPSLASEPGKVSAQAVTSRANKALDWLVTQFAANGHHLKSGFESNGQFQTFDDAGLTIDGLLALAAAGRDGDAEAQEGKAYMASQVDEYVTGSDPNSLYAGSLAKAIVFAVVYDLDANAVDGHDLEADLRGRLQSNGRFTDKATDFQTGQPTDYSNGVGQALAVLALAASDAGAPQSSIDYLVSQQCPNGGFRVQLADTRCTNDEQADLDATSFALTAIDSATDAESVEDELVKGLTFVFGSQKENGSFADNANSTGLASVTVRSFGGHPPANEGATFVKTLQLAGGADAGAILVDKDAYDAAVADGLDEKGRTLAARATAQAVMALGLPAYSLIGAREPVEPATTIALSSTTVPEGGQLTASGGGFFTDEKVRVVVSSDPVTVGEPVANVSGLISQSFTLPASVSPGGHTVTLTGESSGVTIAAPFTVTSAEVAPTTTALGATTPPPTTIVRTGSSATSTQAPAAAVLLMVGASLLVATRRRRIVYPFQK
ncbi:MAG TPA: hypothetical protein VMZ22_11615 [Acidimicrobiales bacterium]|nr:hypothetical protein [Acidimicrobiales bacterium]